MAILTENEKYLSNVREELEAIYNGTTEELNEDGVQVSFFSYLRENVLDYEVTFDSQRNFVGARLYITVGGPTVWINTRESEICITWGTEHNSLWIPSEICEELNEAINECYLWEY